MFVSLELKIKAMLWDFPEDKRYGIAHRIMAKPIETFREDNALFIRALSSITWYELISLLGKQELYNLLTDTTIKKLFPAKRRDYFTNARRLLSKYTLPVSGQDS